jgi:peptidoglycan/xylan/chitin deacetylase (PgdA/CDA1 family)
MSRYQWLKIFFLSVFAALIILRFAVNIPAFIFIIVILAFFIITGIGAFVLSLEMFVSVKSNGTGSMNQIAITFDDGPVVEKTMRILDILRQYKIEAAFFCIGSRIVLNTNLLEQIVKDGHMVGNHTFSHSPLFDFFSAKKVRRELSDTDDAIAEVLGKKPKFFRPPYGVTNPMIAKAVKNGRYIVAGWSVRSFDTVINDPTKLFNRTTRSLKGGDIVLFHDYSDSMLAMLPEFLKHVEQKGFKIVRMDVLLNEKPYQ